MREHETTTGCYAYGKADAPVPPDGEGWRMCGAAADDGMLFWFWEREAPPPLADEPRVTSAPVIQIGSEVLHVRRILGGPPKLVERVTIVRATSKQWVDDAGDRWWRDSLRAGVGLLHRYLMTEEEFVAAGGVLPTEEGAAA